MQEKLRFLGFGCPCGDDRRSDRRAGWRGAKPGNDSQPRRVTTQADQEAWPGRDDEGLL